MKASAKKSRRSLQPTFYFNMAKKTTSVYSLKKQKRNKGVHAKSKCSNNKQSKLYKKKYRGQGKKR